MSSLLSDRLSRARRRQFVGRADELALFQAALAAPELPFCVLYVFGPGGVGKTMMLQEFARACAQQQIPAFHLDGRNVEPTPDAFAGALRRAMGLAPFDAPLQSLASQPGRQVILIDTYETLAPLDAWLRDVFLPQLPEHVLVVLAGRQPPALAWRADPGWQTLIRALPLRNLSPDESRAYLATRAVPGDQHGAVLAFTHGHPLALSLVADGFAQRPGVPFQPEAAPDTIRVLLEQFVQQVPGPAHRAALEACALVRQMTEALLAALLGMPDPASGAGEGVHELFDWLRGLSFVESGRVGLFLHDLAGEALAVDLRWRNPDWYAELRRRARAYYAGRLPQTQGQEQQRVLLDYAYLHRHSMVVRPFYEWQSGAGIWGENSGLTLDVARADDLPALQAMVAAHEGQESAGLLARWFARQPQAFAVLRDVGGITGFLAQIALHQAAAEDLGADPATRAAWQYLQRAAPLRPGEGATYFRFWMARDTYQAISLVQGLIGVAMIRHYLTTPGLAFTFFPCADPRFWAPLCAYTDITRMAEADFTTDARGYGVYGHDWRTVPPVAWLALMAEREDVVELREVRPAPVAPMVVLSRPEFVDAVREALRNFTRLDLLRASPLLRSRLIVERAGAAGDAERASALQALLREAGESLQSSPRDAKAYRALYHTYLHPTATQEQAAELLDLPFGTYRRHLKAGVAYVAEILWQWELQGAET